MQTQDYVCVVCGAAFTRYAPPSDVRPKKLCSRTCQGRFMATNHKAPWLKALNDTPGRNKRIAQENRTNIRAAQPQLGKSNGKTYAKHLGRHEHRKVAEQMLGRRLTKAEVVHHKDNNKRNNNPDNLQVMTRSEHSRLHALERHHGR